MSDEPEYKVTCPYCKEPAKLTSSKEVYGGRDYGMIYLCRCVEDYAYVGCYKNSSQPLGRLADKELRKWKQLTHQAFDPLWRRGNMRRGSAYGWLANQLKIDKENCHIGMFDIETCKQAIDFCGKKGIMNQISA